jgi:uncharacterized protein YodC (DUF2158 family)
MAGKFKPGDIVRLKSGGPDMTVERVSELGDGTTYFCSWFAGAKDNHKGFREQALELADDES